MEIAYLPPQVSTNNTGKMSSIVYNTIRMKQRKQGGVGHVLFIPISIYCLSILDSSNFLEG